MGAPRPRDPSQLARETDEELVNLAIETADGLEGMGLGASIELQRRLRQSIIELKKSTDNASRWLIGLTIGLVLLTGALVALTIALLIRR